MRPRGYFLSSLLQCAHVQCCTAPKNHNDSLKVVTKRLHSMDRQHKSLLWSQVWNTVRYNNSQCHSCLLCITILSKKYHKTGKFRWHEIFPIFVVVLIPQKKYLWNNHCYTVCMCACQPLGQYLQKFNPQLFSLIHCNGHPQIFSTVTISHPTVCKT